MFEVEDEAAFNEAEIAWMIDVTGHVVIKVTGFAVELTLCGDGR